MIGLVSINIFAVTPNYNKSLKDIEATYDFIEEHHGVMTTETAKTLYIGACNNVKNFCTHQTKFDDRCKLIKEKGE